MARIDERVVDTRDWDILEEECDELGDTSPELFNMDEMREVGLGGCLVKSIELQNGRGERITKTQTMRKRRTPHT